MRRKEKEERRRGWGETGGEGGGMYFIAYKTQGRIVAPQRADSAIAHLVGAAR